MSIVGATGGAWRLGAAVSLALLSCQVVMGLEEPVGVAPLGGADDGGLTVADGEAAITDGETTRDAGTETGADAGAPAFDGGPRDNIVFVSKTSVYSNQISSTFRGADDHCNAAANAAGSVVPVPHRPFVAWLSSGTRAAFSRLKAGAWVNVRNQRVAGYDELKRGDVSRPIDLDETGELRSGEYVWTATDANSAFVGGRDCAGWSSREATVKALVGRSGSFDANWTAAGDLSCSGGYRLYCFETGLE